MLKIKRVYEPYDKNDGYRILVDRLWPRGVSKEKARLDLWLKEIAPSDTLRKWFAHDIKKWDDFQIKYKKELGENSETLEKLQQVCKSEKTVTLLFGAKDAQHNQAVVLLDVLRQNGH